jgi:glycosyltransferase involved in cell wall biosynthesis
MLENVTEGGLSWLYANCIAVIQASFEDFGLVPLEAAQFGRPSIVLRKGGFLDTVRDGETGVFFNDLSPAAMTAAVERALSTGWQVEVIRAHADTFSYDRFRHRIRAVAEEELRLIH